MTFYSSSSDRATYTNATNTNDSQSVIGQQKKKHQRGAMMMAKLTKVCKSGVRLWVEFNVVYNILDGPHSSLFNSYVVFLGHIRVIILLDDWKDVTNEVKNNIWTDVQVY